MFRCMLSPAPLTPSLWPLSHECVFFNCPVSASAFSPNWLCSLLFTTCTAWKSTEWLLHRKLVWVWLIIIFFFTPLNSSYTFRDIHENIFKGRRTCFFCLFYSVPICRQLILIDNGRMSEWSKTLGVLISYKRRTAFSFILLRFLL